MSSFASQPYRVVLSITALGLIAICSLPAAAIAEGVKPVEAINAGLFEAMDAGQVEVKIIPYDAAKANVLVKNLTDKPLELRLPTTFASVPILAQMGMGGGGMGGMGGGGMGGGMGGGGGQAGGGGMGGGGMGGGGMGGGGMGMGGGGFMRVPPQRMKKVKVTTVCLEHGKPDPNPRLAYKLVPLEQFTDNPRIRVICEALGHGQITQNIAQAAAWHIMDGLSWQELAVKNRLESKYFGNVRWFSTIELRAAMAAVGEATRIAESSDSSGDETYVEDRYEG